MESQGNWNYQDRVLKRGASWEDSLYPRQGVLGGRQTPGPVGSTEPGAGAAGVTADL